MALQAFPQSFYFVQSLLLRSENGVRIVEVNSSEVGEGDAVAGAGKKRYSQLLFQLLDVLGEGGLGDEAPLRRPGDILLLGCGDKILHNFCVHSVFPFLCVS